MSTKQATVVASSTHFSTRLTGSSLITFRVSAVKTLRTPPSGPVCGGPSSICAIADGSLISVEVSVPLA